MVNLTNVLLKRSPWNNQLDPMWRQRRFLKFAAHFYGRRRNCFSIAIRAVQHHLRYITYGRAIWKEKMRNVWEDRLNAGCRELGYIPEGRTVLLESLARSNILLNRQSLSNLAIWEPRTFKALNKIAAVKAREEGDGLNQNLGPMPPGIITKGRKL